MTSFESESVTLEPVIFLRTYAFAVGGVLTLLSQLPSLLALRRLNLAAATKEIGT